MAIVSASNPVVKRYTYPFDPTGRQESNLVKKEVHVITAQNRTPQNVLIPGYAPFFRDSLVVRERTTGAILREMVDYSVEWPIILDRTEGYTPVYLAIQFIDERLVGEFELQYQTIGGSQALDGVAVAQALANQANDPRTTTYEDVLGKPLQFPPIEHVHSIDDFVGFNDLVQVLLDIKETLIANAREDRDAHPGYDTLVDEYFRLLEELNAFRSNTNEGIDTIKADIVQLTNQTKLKLDELKRTIDEDITNKLNLAKQDRDNIRASLEAAKQEINTFITNSFNTFRDETNAALQALRSDVASKDTALRQLIQQKETSLKNDYTAKINALQSDLNRKDADLRTLISNAKTELANDYNTKINNVNTALNNAKSDYDAKINRARSDLSGDYNNKITNLTNRVNDLDRYNVKTSDISQSIQGTKTFQRRLRVDDGIGFWNGRTDLVIRPANEGGQEVLAFNRIALDDFYIRSDKRVKTEIAKIRNAVDVLKALNGYTYNLHIEDSVKPSAGVIAQEVQKVLPDLVAKNDKTGLLSVNQIAFFGYVIEAIKELDERIAKLENK